jgi:hypothetical protein
VHKLIQARLAIAGGKLRRLAQLPRKGSATARGNNGGVFVDSQCLWGRLCLAMVGSIAVLDFGWLTWYATAGRPVLTGAVNLYTAARQPPSGGGVGGAANGGCWAWG